MDLKAVVMAGGKGTRLYPYTATIPKPLVPVGDYPILELVLRQLKAHGFTEVVLTVNHLQHLIRSFFGDGGHLGIEIRYWVEDEPLGTCGSLGSLLSSMPDSFLVMNGDVLTDLDYSAFATFHRETGGSATIAAFQRLHQVSYGVLELDARGQLQKLVEKPELPYTVSMGIYMLQRDEAAKVLPATPTYRDMPSLLMDLVDGGGKVVAYPSDCTWLDIGNPKDLARAQEIMRESPMQFLPAVQALKTLSA